jgi:hypothetical protein
MFPPGRRILHGWIANGLIPGKMIAGRAHPHSGEGREIQRARKSDQSGVELQRHCPQRTRL